MCIIYCLIVPYVLHSCFMFRSFLINYTAHSGMEQDLFVMLYPIQPIIIIHDMTLCIIIFTSYASLTGESLERDYHTQCIVSEG